MNRWLLALAGWCVGSVPVALGCGALLRMGRERAAAEARERLLAHGRHPVAQAGRAVRPVSLPPAPATASSTVLARTSIGRFARRMP